MGKDLSHLTAEEIETLMRRYYNGEAVSKLIKEYDISVHASELYKLFPPEVYQDYSCEYCDEFLVINRPSKMTKNAPKYERDLYCPICMHRPYASKCNCSNCLEEERLLEDERRDAIYHFYSLKKEPVAFDELPFASKVYLGALCRALMKENMFEISPYAGSGVCLAPTQTLCKELYQTLLSKGVITISPHSSVDAFDVDSDYFPNSPYLNRVIYQLNLNYPQKKQEVFGEILNPSYYSPDNSEEAFDLWKKIAVSECVEYLQYQLDRVKFEFSPGDKTYKTFEIILNDFSVSQIYGIIWKAVADASKLYLEKGMSKKHAANTVIGACERYAERAKLNGWDLTQYNRVKDLPQSVLSLFYFNRVLGIGEMGFKIPPTIV